MPAIEVQGLTKRYGDRVVVDDVTLTVDEGEIFGIVGPNGAGKTTIVETIEGLRAPDGGRVRVLGLDPISDAAEVRQRLGAQLQESRLPDKLKVREAMELFASFYRDPASWPRLLERLGLSEQRETRYKALSGGQKQRLSAALALVGNPEVAVLDELTTGLDPQARRDTWRPDRTDQGRWRHRRAGHALHGGGRAAERPHRRDRRRTRRGDRHAGGSGVPERA